MHKTVLSKNINIITTIDYNFNHTFVSYIHCNMGQHSTDIHDVLVFPFRHISQEISAIFIFCGNKLLDVANISLKNEKNALKFMFHKLTEKCKVWVSMGHSV